MNFYASTIPNYERMLKNMDAILVKAQAWAAEKKISEETVLKARLALDMFPFVKQVQIMSDNAKGTVARLCGKEPVKMEDNEASFEELRTRIQKTLDLLASFSEADFEGAEERTFVMPYHNNRLLTAENYVQEYAIPNFFFHCVTAYDILRHFGMPVGKGDYIGTLSLFDPQA